MHNAENKIDVAKRKMLTKLPSNMTDELIFRKSGDLSPDQNFAKVLTLFKNTIVENPRKAKLAEE